MKYKLIGNNDYFFNPIETILHNRGIANIKEFLKLNESVIYDWKLLNNIEKAALTTISMIQSNKKAWIQADADCDGMVSAAVLFNYLKKAFPNADVAWRVHEVKMHGVIAETVPSDADLIFIPDAGSNQYSEHKILRDLSKTVIILDHHLCEKESEDAIVVNNQLSLKYPNKNLSGVGIVYKFCKALDHYLEIDYADDFLDLVAIGNIADSMDLRELETRFYVQTGLNQIKNRFLSEIIKKQEYPMKGVVNITNISFFIVPLINAVTRVGTIEERENTFKSLIESEESVYYKRKDTWESIIDNTARQVNNVRNRQNRLRDSGINEIEERINTKGLKKNKILVVNVSDILESSLTGLVANKISERYMRPTLLLKRNEEGVYKGSGRGHEKCNIKDFRNFLLNTRRFVFCEGHAQAFGASITKEQLVSFLDDIELFTEGVSLNDIEVDFEIPFTKVNKRLFEELCGYSHLWSKGVEEPLVVIKEVPIHNDSFVITGKKQDGIKFVSRGVEFLKTQCSEEEVDTFANNQNKCVNLIGKCSMNEWKGERKHQFIIDDFEFTKKFSLNF
ncbi:DHH family phosphoesterase [Brevibacillus laterosporus]|uniref:Single-stranded-DNA-specific exonuclease RecJ n=1 Tax=Brevibacillus laterosporus TaxID=1465 RepID=A0AAP8QGH0_BRELA|nr:DHH family phosphoesterase [Brevibacillus laterosporus]PPB12934.1 single-stranded-DNA-specific exonuclease RecJ [Brevibacillus laterosporus]